MKKLSLIIAVVTLTFTTTLSPVLANENLTPTEKKTALKILGDQVNRDIIRELQLNEMQYVQLKDLNKTYKEELAEIKAQFITDTITSDTKTTDLNNKYFAALSEVLTSQQITVYLTKHTQVNMNK